MDLAAYGRRRDAVRDRIVEVLEADPRVQAVWLSGSFGRGEADEWSDLDLHVAVADESFSTFLEERSALYAHIDRPLLIQREMPSNSIGGGRFQLVVYPGPVEVDWNIGPVGEARRPRDSVLLVDRVEIPEWTLLPQAADEQRAQAEWDLTFFWAMAPIAVKYAGRGKTQQAASQINLLTRTYISLRRLLVEPDGFDPRHSSLNRPLGPELTARLPRLGWTIDPLAALAVIRALCKAVEQFHPALAARGVMIPAGTAREVAALSVVAETVVRNRGGEVTGYESDDQH